MSRLEKIKIWAKLTWLDLRAYPKTTLVAGLILTAIISLVFTWPSVALFKYALGITAGMTNLQLSALAAQYVGAFSFWGHLAGITAVSALSLLYGIKGAVTSMSAVYQIIAIVKLNLFFEETIKARLSNQIDLSQPEKEQFNALLDSVLTKIFGSTNRLSLTLRTSLDDSNKIYLEIARNIEPKMLEELMKDFLNLEAANGRILEFTDTVSKQLWTEIIKQSLKVVIQNNLLAGYLLERACENYPVPSYVKVRFEKVLREEIANRGTQYLGLKDLQEKFLDKGLTPYDILGVKKSDSVDKIYKACRKKLLYCHPDKAKTPDAAEQFLLLTAARDLLVNPCARANVDRELLKHNIVNLDPKPSDSSTLGTVPGAVTMMRAHGVATKSSAPTEGSECGPIIPYRPFAFKF